MNVKESCYKASYQEVDYYSRILPAGSPDRCWIQLRPMKQILKESQLLLLTIFVISCNNENCLDINFGDEFLKPISLTYESFDGINAVVYKDIQGNEHRYELFPDVDLIRNHVSQDSCDGELITIRHRSEYYLRRYSSPNNTAIAFAVTVDFLEGEQIFAENRLVDILKVSVFDDNIPPDHLSRICIMTSSRGGIFDKEVFNSNEYIEYDSLSILNKKFYNVFEQRNGVIKMYYTTTDGIVSFFDNTGTQLVLDHVE